MASGYHSKGLEEVSGFSLSDSCIFYLVENDGRLIPLKSLVPEVQRESDDGLAFKFEV